MLIYGYTYSNVKFEKVLQLTSDIIVLDEETRERKRDETIPVSFIQLSKSEEKQECKVASYVKGRYVMIKLVSDQNVSQEASNVDVQYVGIHGYRMD